MSDPATHMSTTSRRLSEQTLRNVFDGLDTDGDGRLTKDDLRRVWRSNGGRLSELFDKLDLDGSGALSFAEFLIAYDGMHDQGNAETEEESAMDRQLHQVFDFVDVDGDGMITVTELAMAANQVIGRALTQSELRPLHERFGGMGGLTFEKFKSFLVDWAQGGEAAHEDDEEEPEMQYDVFEPEPSPPAANQGQLLNRPSFVRDNSRTIISSEAGDPETIAAKREVRVLEALLLEVRDEKLQLQAECDELRFNHDHLMTLTTTLKARTASLQETAEQLQDQLHTQQTNFEIAKQEVVAERLEKARLQKEMRTLQSEYAELRAQQSIRDLQDVIAAPSSPAQDQQQQRQEGPLVKNAHMTDTIDDAREEIAILELECRQLQAQNAEVVLRMEQSSSLSEKLKQENEDLQRNLQFLNDVVNQRALSTAPGSEMSNTDWDESRSSIGRSSRRQSLADELQEEPGATSTKATLSTMAVGDATEKQSPSYVLEHSDHGSTSTDHAEPQTEQSTPHTTTRYPPSHQHVENNAHTSESSIMDETLTQKFEATPTGNIPPASPSAKSHSINNKPEAVETQALMSGLPLLIQEAAESRPVSKTTALSAKPGGTASPLSRLGPPDFQRQHSHKMAGEGALERRLKEDTAKDLPPAKTTLQDINVKFRGDYLGVANDSALKTAISLHGGSTDEKVLFADSVGVIREKILTFGDVRSTNEKRRVLILTSHAVYNVKPHAWRITRRIPLEELVSIRMNSKGAGLFVIQVADDGDFILRSARWIELVSAVRRATYQKRKVNLDADYKDNVRIRMDDGTAVILEVDVATQMVSLRRTHPVVGPTG